MGPWVAVPLNTYSGIINIVYISDIVLSLVPKYLSVKMPKAIERAMKRDYSHKIT